MPPRLLGLVLASSQMVSHGLGLYLVGALLPLISQDLGIGYARLGFVVGASTVGYVVGSLLAGRVLTRMAPVPVLVLAHVALAVLFGVFTLASHPSVLAAVSAGIGFMGPLGWISVVRVAGTRERSGLVLAMASSGGAVGLIVNAGVLRVLSTASAWRVGFWVAAAVSLAVAALMLRVPAPGGGHDSVIDGCRSPITVVVITLAACAAVATSPFVAFVVAMVIEELGRSAALGAAVVVVAGLAGIVSAPVMGRVIDRSGPVPALRIGAFAFAVSVAWTAVAPGAFSLALAAVGFGFLNYPVWAVIGMAAGRVLPPAGVTRLMSRALVSFGVSASVAVPLTGVVFEKTGTLRPALVAFALTGSAMAALAGRLES